MVDNNRIIGIDILRILSMFGIIGLHLINRGGILNSIDINNYKYYGILFLLIIFYTSVNCFGILTGFLNCKKAKIKSNRIIELIEILAFYSIIIALIFYIFNIAKVSEYGYIEMIKNFFPILVGRYWYITCYVFVFFMIPYINLLIKKIGEKNSKRLVITLFVLLSLIPNIIADIDLFRTQSGYSPFWLMFCYIVGAYINIYNKEIDTKKIVLLFITILFATYAFNVTIRIVGVRLFGRVVKGLWMISYTSPTNLIMSILLLLLFKKINIKSNTISKIIISLSGTSFSVYIIHCHKLFYDYILNNNLKWISNYNIIISIILIFVIIIAIYMLCSIIDLLRVFIHNYFKINKVNEKIGIRLDKIINIEGDYNGK